MSKCINTAKYKEGIWKQVAEKSVHTGLITTCCYIVLLLRKKQQVEWVFGLENIAEQWLVAGMPARREQRTAWQHCCFSMFEMVC